MDERLSKGTSSEGQLEGEERGHEHGASPFGGYFPFKGVKAKIFPPLQGEGQGGDGVQEWKGL